MKHPNRAFNLKTPPRLMMKVKEKSLKHRDPSYVFDVDAFLDRQRWRFFRHYYHY